MENIDKNKDILLKGFNTITQKKLNDYINNQKGKTWDIYSERSFIENLFCQRINYFILAYSLVITAASMLFSNLPLFCISLIFGIIILSFLWSSLCRAHIKLDVLIRMIHNLPQEDNVFSLYQNEVRSLYRFKDVKINKMLAHWLPFTCLSSLFAFLLVGLLFKCTACDI